MLRRLYNYRIRFFFVIFTVDVPIRRPIIIQLKRLMKPPADIGITEE